MNESGGTVAIAAEAFKGRKLKVDLRRRIRVQQCCFDAVEALRLLVDAVRRLHH
jgi:hypothetical protein